MLYQVLNSSGYVASCETNPLALFNNNTQARKYIAYLVVDCGCENTMKIKQIKDFNQIVRK